ncbi:hypothetical protein V6N13_053979 [Hibiscus sabdariffa]|uniref:Uncharacterized protein n=1 Tax=Hibiscus sabdariffa TaxID=183260 RepID=A0ABR2T6L8_9ROSI
MENPKNAMGPIVDPQLDPSGRPPDPVVQVELPTILERPGSPTALEDQREPKKNRSSGIKQGEVSLVEENMAMEADLEDGSDEIRVHVPKSGDSAPQQVGLNSGKVSYANMVT